MKNPRPYGRYSVEKPEDEAFVLPDPLTDESGRPVTTAAHWIWSRRSEVLRLMREYEYGQSLPRPDKMEFELLSRRDDALGGIAIRKEVRLHLSMSDGRRISGDLLLYAPRGAAKPAPAFLGLNFNGNHDATDEDDVGRTGFRKPGVLVHPESQGKSYRFQFEETIRRGYASATMCYHDLHPDFTGSEGESVFRLFFQPDEYAGIIETHSVIGAWAWGLSRCLDYLESDPLIDAERVAVHGHSRLGKTSLWAGATDRRFKMVVSNNSGCGGATLHKRKFGENLSQHFESHIMHGVPAWFVQKAESFIWREEDLPIDQHMLLALIAPRALCLGTAEEDLPADPYGEFLAAKAASPVYELFGEAGLTARDMPALNSGVAGPIGFHYRSGEHNMGRQDWEWYWAAADRYL